jgi:hypothetical protein
MPIPEAAKNLGVWLVLPDSVSRRVRELFFGATQLADAFAGSTFWTIDNPVMPTLNGGRNLICHGDHLLVQVRLTV